MCAWRGGVGLLDLLGSDRRCRGGGKGKGQQLYHHRREINLSKCFVVDAPSYGTRSSSFLGENFVRSTHHIIRTSVRHQDTIKIFRDLRIRCHITRMFFPCVLTWAAIPDTCCVLLYAQEVPAYMWCCLFFSVSYYFLLFFLFYSISEFTPGSLMFYFFNCIIDTHSTQFFVFLYFYLQHMYVSVDGWPFNWFYISPTKNENGI